MAKRILIVYYSQTGEVERAVEAFVRPLREAGHEVTLERVTPVEDYPYPWSPGRFFEVFPDCLNERPPPMQAPGFAPDARFDLVVLAYQVWFLSPSLPIQGFLRSDHAQILANTDVITITVCRNMWHNAYMKLQRMLGERQARLRDNIVVTHQGPPWTTFITTVRTVLTGKKDRLMGVMPPAAVAEQRIAEVGTYGEVVAARLGREAGEAGQGSRGPMLQGLGAVEVDRNYVIPELVGGRAFAAWARLAERIGRVSQVGKAASLVLFVGLLGVGIVTVIPISILGALLLRPLVREPMEAHIAQLKLPSG